MDRLRRFVADIDQATHFDIQNVADYFFTYQDEEAWDMERDFTIAPPFDFFATHYQMPDSFGPYFSGVENLAVFRVVNGPPPPPRMTITVGEGAEMNPYDPALVPTARWHVLVKTFAAVGRQVRPPVDWFLAIDERGRLCRYRGHIALWLTDMGQSHGVGIIANTFIQVSFLALTFLHSKNVEILPPQKVTGRRLPREQKLLSRYHRLKVNAIGKRSEKSATDPTGISQSLHIVRGHFREYGPEFGKGKLFGKWSGRYWIAGHISGSLERGLVTKDYEIIPPGDENETHQNPPA